MDWHWIIGIQGSLLFWCVKIHHSIIFDTVNKVIEKKMQESIMTKLLMNARKKQSDNTGYWSDEMKKHFVNVQHWSLEKWISVLTTGGGQKKRFQYCLNPKYLQKFMFLRAIHGYSGSTIHPALFDNVLLSECFTRIFIMSETEKNWGQ